MFLIISLIRLYIVNTNHYTFNLTIMPKDVITRNTTLAEIGVDSPDVSGSLKAPLIVTKKRYGRGTVYLAQVERPSAGSMLAHLLNSISKQTPYRMGDSSGIVGDLPLPEQARSKYASDEVKQRDARHRNSFIGSPYVEIDRNHRQRWMDAFAIDPEPVRVISDFLESLHCRHIDYLVEDSKKYRKIHDNSGKPSSWLNFIQHDLRPALGNKKFREANAMIGDQLTPEELRDYILISDHAHRTVVDFDAGRAYISGRYQPKTVTILPPNKLLWNNANFNYSIDAGFKANIIGGDMNWSLENYDINFTERYDERKAQFEKAALTPLIVWITDPNGKREYIPQARVRQMKWHHMPENSDVLLGRVLAAHLTPGIIGLWQDQMPLGKDGRKNRIMGAQALILASLPQPNFGGRVLRDPEGVLAKIEACLAA